MNKRIIHLEDVTNNRANNMESKLCIGDDEFFMVKPIKHNYFIAIRDFDKLLDFLEARKLYLCSNGHKWLFIKTKSSFDRPYFFLKTKQFNYDPWKKVSY